LNTYVYELDDNLYINLTNKCSNACEFCVRNGKDSYFGNSLWLEKEPTAEDVIEELKKTDIKKYREVVFCGFGEPTYKIAELIKIAGYVKEKGGRTRLNTNGQGNLINGCDITEKLESVLDAASISLNEATAEKYQKICHSVFGEAAYEAIFDFAVKCREKGIDTVLSVVDSIGAEDVKKCRELAKSKNIRLKVRKLIENS